MSLVAGQRLSQYEILGPLGAGGMGEVYRARDTQLGREVAIKVLPEQLGEDAERRRRFLREAKALAALNHPNVAGIHGVGQHDGIDFLALELVPGEDLAPRLARGPLPVNEAIDVARQIAEGLEAAHEAGVVHRDLKPANVRVTPDGVVKVLDFGLAKPGAAAGSDPGSASDSLHLTEAGVVLGTPTYMSPEQARGKPVDRRTDLWSLGCVLYECLTGRRPFDGETLSDVLAAVLNDEPDLARLPAATPPAIRQLVARCLVKDPRQRLRDAGDARLVLQDPHSIETAARPRSRTRWPAMLGAIAIGFGLAGVALGWFLAGRDGAPPADDIADVGRVRFVLPQRDERGDPEISPDGLRIVFVQDQMLWVRDLDRFEPRPVEGSQNASAPFWSPDGEWLGFVAEGRLWRVPRQGGEPALICDLVDGAWNDAGGACWGSDGNITFTTGDTGLYQVPARGGDAEVFLPVDAETELDYHNLSALPDGHGFLYVLHRRGGDQRSIDTLVAYDGERHELLRVPGASLMDPVYSPSGHVIYGRTGTNEGLWALPLRLDPLAPAGDPLLVVNGGNAPSISRNGTLIYVPSDEGRLTQLAWLGRDGEVLERLEPARRFFPCPALSPDGDRVAVPAMTNNRLDLWLYDLRSEGARQITSCGDVVRPAWAPDNRTVYFAGEGAAEGELRRVDADSGEAPTHVGRGEDPAPGRVGGTLYFARRVDDNFELMRSAADGTDPEVLDTSDVRGPIPSPQEDLLAYCRWDLGQYEVYVRDLGGAGGHWKVSSAGGMWPRWHSDGRKLIYVDGREVLEVEVDRSGDVPRFSRPVPLFTLPVLPYSLEFPASTEVTQDGSKFLAVVGLPGAELADQVAVVVGFSSLLRGE